MSGENIAGLAVAVLVLVHLIIALLFPERF